MPRRMIPRNIELYRDHSASYETVDVEGRPHVVCPQCLTPVLLCQSLSDRQRRKAAKLRETDSVAAMDYLTKAVPCGERSAKAVVLHLRKKDEGCHYCGHPMPRGALLCANCMSVNLDWN